MIALSLTLPPSTNHLWSNAPGKGRVRTAAYKEWINIAGWEIKAAVRGHQTITGPYELKIQVAAPRYDIDNVGKATSDLLKTMNLVSDDKNMMRLVIERCDGPRGIRIELEEFA